MADAGAGVAVEAGGEKQVCRMFRNSNPNQCRFGANCKYLHTTGDPIEVPKRDPGKPRDECFNWRDKTECKYDSRCRFLHGEADERFDASGKRKGAGRKKRQGRNGKAAAVPDSEAKQEGKQNDTSPTTPTEGRRKNRRPRNRKPKVRQVDADGKEVCRNFGKSNECQWKEECKFSHSAAVGPAPETQAVAPKERRQRRKKPKGPGLCYNFSEQAQCDWGDGCRFRHGENDQREIPKKKPGPCYKLRAGNCEFGAKCRFSHDPEVDAEAPASA